MNHFEHRSQSQEYVYLDSPPMLTRDCMLRNQPEEDHVSNFILTSPLSLRFLDDLPEEDIQEF